MNYSALSKTAQRLIGKNGTKCILRNPSGKPPVYNPTTDEYETETIPFDGVCIISSFEEDMIDGTIIQSGDQKIIAVLMGDPVPKLSTLDVFDKAGKLRDSYKIVNSTTISPDSTVVICVRLQCRK
jgi:hypothetical protein